MGFLVLEKGLKKQFSLNVPLVLLANQNWAWSSISIHTTQCLALDCQVDVWAESFMVFPIMLAWPMMVFDVPCIMLPLSPSCKQEKKSSF